MSLLKKMTLSKLRFSVKENLKKCTIFEEQKGTNSCLRSLLVLFCFSGDKTLLSVFLRK